VTVLIKHDILWLKVAMYDALGVDVLQHPYKLAAHAADVRRFHLNILLRNEAEISLQQLHLYKVAAIRSLEGVHGRYTINSFKGLEN
jgi:hypothetical protein